MSLQNVLSGMYGFDIYAFKSVMSQQGLVATGAGCANWVLTYRKLSAVEGSEAEPESNRYKLPATQAQSM